MENPKSWTQQYKQLTVFLLLFVGLILTFIENKIGTGELVWVIFESFALALGALILWSFVKRLWK